MTTLFRTSVVDAMPTPVKSRLEDVVGLTSKSHREFCEHVIHAIEKYRRDEQRAKRTRQRHSKVTQLQLGELTSKNKKKIQASVVEAVEVPVITSTPGSPAPPVQPPPVIHVYAPQPTAKTNLSRQYDSRENFR